MTVVLCYDGSASAKRAIDVVAHVMRDQDVALVHVYNPPVPYLADSFSDPGRETGPSMTQLEHDSRGFAEERLREGEEAARAAGLNVSPQLEASEASVGRALLDVADRLDATAIVLGTHGRTAVEDALLGSVSSEVLHHATRPVLVIPAGDPA
jgi:nucleotide-binding universal stress UspA family protein